MACVQLVCDDRALCKAAAACVASAFKPSGCSLPIHMTSSSSHLPPNALPHLLIFILDPLSRASVAALHLQVCKQQQQQQLLCDV